MKWPLQQNWNRLGCAKHSLYWVPFWLMKFKINHFPGQLVLVPDNSFSERILPDIQSKPSLAQFGTISSCPVACYLGEETNPHLAKTSLQGVVEWKGYGVGWASVTAKQNAILQKGILWLCITQIDSFCFHLLPFGTCLWSPSTSTVPFCSLWGNKIMRCCPVSRASFGRMIFSSFLCVLPSLPASLCLVVVSASSLTAQDDNGKEAGGCSTDTTGSSRDQYMQAYMHLLLVISVSSSLDCPHSATALSGNTWLQAHVKVCCLQWDLNLFLMVNIC